MNNAFRVVEKELYIYFKTYYTEIASEYRRRYDILAGGLRRLGWTVNDPDGSYFLLVDIRDLDVDDDREWAVRLARLISRARGSR